MTPSGFRPPPSICLLKANRFLMFTSSCLVLRTILKTRAWLRPRVAWTCTCSCRQLWLSGTVCPRSARDVLATFLTLARRRRPYLGVGVWLKVRPVLSEPLGRFVIPVWLVPALGPARQWQEGHPFGGGRQAGRAGYWLAVLVARRTRGKTLKKSVGDRGVYIVLGLLPSRCGRG